MRDDAATRVPSWQVESGADDLALIERVLRVQERIIMTDGYGPPAQLLFWIGLAAFYAPRVRRVCRPRLQWVSQILPRTAILTLTGRRR